MNDLVTDSAMSEQIAEKQEILMKRQQPVLPVSNFGKNAEITVDPFFQ